MDYEKKYKEALERAKIYCKEHTMVNPKNLIPIIFPELRESEDERIRKAIIELLKEVGRDDTGISENAKCMIAWLEKQKEPENVSASTIAPSCWQKEQKQNPLEDYSRGYNDGYYHGITDSKQKPTLEQTLDAYKISDERATAKMEGRIEGRQDVINNPEEYGLQKPAEPCVTNNESDYDKGYREGHKFGLKQNEEYMLPGGKTFSGLIPCWVDAPSTLQPAHKHHGKNLIVMHENNGGFRCCCIDNEKPVTFHLPEDTHLIEGWNKKPAEWSEEEEKMIKSISNVICGNDWRTKEERDKMCNWLKSLRPLQQEWSVEDRNKLNRIFEIIGRSLVSEREAIELQDFIVSIHPRYSWKPSEDQIEALGRNLGGNPFLVSLYNDLLRLK